MDGHVGGWRKGDSFSHDLVSVGPASNPHALFLFPRRAVSVTGLAVLASLGHSGIPSHHAAPPPPSSPPPAAVSCSLSVSIFCWSSLVSLSSIFCPSAYAGVTRQHLAISHAVSVSPAIFLKMTSFFTGWTKVCCENKVKEDKNKYMPHSNKVKHQKYIQIGQLFKHQWGSFKPALFSHTCNLFFSPVWHVKIFLTSRTTRFSAPLGFYVSMATSEGSSCYYHQSLTSQPSAFTFFCFDWHFRMCLFCVCLCFKALKRIF